MSAGAIEVQVWDGDDGSQPSARTFADLEIRIRPWLLKNKYKGFNVVVAANSSLSTKRRRRYVLLCDAIAEIVGYPSLKHSEWLFNDRDASLDKMLREDLYKQYRLKNSDPLNLITTFDDLALFRLMAANLVENLGKKIYG